MCSQVIVEQSDGTKPIAVLEREITALATQIHSATCRWLGLVAEYDAREGWAVWGCKSCANWVSWQCGIAPGSAREQLRVARRLVELPLIRAAFAEGELSYSKVRALTRVENVEREQDLLDLARHATALQLERLLRAYRGVVAAERAAAGEPPERWIAFDHADDGSVLLRGRLPAEEGALVMAALEAARDRLAEQDVPAGTLDGGAAGADEIVRGDVPAETSGAAEIVRADVPAETSRAAEIAPADVPAGTPRRSPAEARADALVALADSFLAGGADRPARTGGDRYQVVVHADAATLSGHEPGGRCELEDGSPLAIETVRRLACDASLVQLLERDGQPLRIGRKTRTIPPALRRALNSRDRGCRFPGCGSRRFLDAHHIEHWADGGATDLDNLIHLCGHHHRLLHEGGYRMTRTAGGGILFHRRDGRPIPVCPGRTRGGPARLPATRRPDACVPLSNDRLDIGLAVDAVLAFAPLTTGEPPGI